MKITKESIQHHDLGDYAKHDFRHDTDYSQYPSEALHAFSELLKREMRTLTQRINELDTTLGPDPAWTKIERPDDKKIQYIKKLKRDKAELDSHLIGIKKILEDRALEEDRNRQIFFRPGR